MDKKSKNQETKTKIAKTLIDIFTCLICTEKANDPHMCPRCSKIFCYVCIERWLADTESPHCPNCRATLLASDVIKCRWAGQLDCVIDIYNGASQDPGCDTHDKRLAVFCVTCNSFICHVCIYDGSAHKGHSFQSIEQRYNKAVVELAECSASLRARADLIRKKTELLTTDVERIDGVLSENESQVASMSMVLLLKNVQTMKKKLKYTESHSSKAVFKALAVKKPMEQMVSVATPKQDVKQVNPLPLLVKKRESASSKTVSDYSTGTIVIIVLFIVYLFYR